MQIGEHLRIQLTQFLREAHWLDVAESVSLGCSAAGTVAAALLQQVGYAAAPITLALFFNFFNQKRRDRGEVSQQVSSALTAIDRRFYDLDERLKNLPQPTEINLTEIYDELTKLNRSLPMIEGKAAFMTAKVHDKLLGQINSLSEQLTKFAEPFDLTRLEAKIASLNVAVQFLAQRPQIDPEEMEKLHDRLLGLESDRQNSILPYLERLDRESQHLHQTDLGLSRKFDAMNQKFAARPEVAQLSKLTRMVAQLSDSVNQIQHTEAIANLYEDIAQIKKELNQLQQHLTQHTDLTAIQEIRKISPSPIIRSDSKRQN